jgi:hypothetical protein
METDTLTVNPTIDVPTSAQLGAVAGATGVPSKSSLLFYSVGRFNFATELTFGAFLQEVTSVSEEERFRQSAVKSVPRSWRDL